MAPGSQVVSDYYDRAGLWPYLEKLGFYLVGYGCTTCIGNSGPLPDEISKAVNDNDLSVAAVLSGNRNFEGRINPDVKMNYLASPPLVIAYALAGTMDFDFDSQPLGKDTDGNDVFLKDIWPSQKDVSDTIASAINQEMFTKNYADVFKGDERWRNLPTPSGNTFEWDPNSTYVRKPPYFEGMSAEPEPVGNISGARVLALLGDSVTTDHISPAGAIKPGTPAAQYLDEHGVDRKDYNSFGSRRGNHEVMIRGTFANIRLRNLLLDDVSGGYTRDFTQDGGPQAFIYDAAQNYAAQNIPLVVLGGKEYGSGSSRDWAAKGTLLLGVRAVIAESFERIHRSNLIGMGVIPLQFPEGKSAKELGLDGTEVFEITGIDALNDGKTPKTVHVKATKDRRATQSSSTRWCASTPPAKRIITATAASCSTCCATCSSRANAQPPVPKVSEDHLAARRRQILDGARRCFAEYGYDKATVRRLEKAVGLSRGAIFHHFRDKDTLFFALAHEDAERMAEVASREGLIQVMRDMLAAPDQFDWLVTRLEIARKLRTDPAFSHGWAERSAELAAATTDRLLRQKQAGRVRDDVPSDVLHCYLDLVLDGLVARLASGEDPQRLAAVLDLVENSVRRS